MNVVHTNAQPNAQPSSESTYTRVDPSGLGSALEQWGHFADKRGRVSAPGEWIGADGELYRAKFDRTELDVLSVDAQHFVVHRTADFTHRVNTTSHVVVVQLAGHSVLHPADGRAPVTLGPGDLSYGDPSVAYRWEFDGPMSVMMLRLPFAALRLAPAGLRPLLGEPFSAHTGKARFAVSFARDLLREGAQLQGMGGPNRLRDTVAHFDEALAERRPGTCLADPSEPAFRRALDYISAHLDAELTVQSVAEATGMSPRYLQLLFQRRSMTVSSWVKHRRLELARQALVDPAWAGADLMQIALAHGFADHAHFTRNFRAAFGETPSAWRGGRRGHH